MKTRHLPLFCALCALAAGQAAFCQVERWPHVVDLALATTIYHAVHEAQALRTQSVDETAVTTGGINQLYVAPFVSDEDTEAVADTFINPVEWNVQEVQGEIESAMRWIGDNYAFKWRSLFDSKVKDLVADIGSLAAEGEGADETETEAETEEGPLRAITIWRQESQGIMANNLIANLANG